MRIWSTSLRMMRKQLPLARNSNYQGIFSYYYFCHKYATDKDKVFSSVLEACGFMSLCSLLKTVHFIV